MKNLEDIVRIINELLSTDSIIVHGSYARNDYHDESDIDLLIVTDQKIRTHIVKELLETTFKKEFSITIISKSSFHHLWRKGVLFIFFSLKHGVVLFDKKFVSGFDVSSFPFKNDYKVEVLKELRKSDLYLDFKKYEGCFTYTLSKIFIILKRVAIYNLTEMGFFITNKREAIEKYYSSRCSIEDVKFILSLEKYTRKKHINNGSKSELKKGLSLIATLREEYDR